MHEQTRQIPHDERPKIVTRRIPSHIGAGDWAG